MSAFGSFFQAKSDQAALRSEARIMDINARIAEDTARRTVAAGVVEESRVKLKGAQVEGAQIASFAGRGIDIAGSASAQSVLAGTKLITQEDAATLRANAMRAALGQRITADNYRSSADAARASADSISPGLALGASLIQSAGQVAKSWYSMNKEGAFAGGSPKLNPVKIDGMTLPSDIVSGNADGGDDWTKAFGFDSLTPKRYRNTSILADHYGEGL